MQSTIPEPGRLVSVRQRRYVVTAVQRSTLVPDVLAARALLPQHRVSLASVEDDALGEELQVIWEIEPGAQLIEGSALPAPTAFDDPARFDAFLDAVRWGAVASADLRAMQAPFRSGIAIEDYQLDPMVRAIQLPRANLLIADDVGLGKTIEAGLVAQELILRHRVRTVLVVCPAALQIQWRDQLRDKFGLEFRIVDTELLRTLRRERGLHTNPWTHFPRLITSIDFLKRDRPMRLLREVLPQANDPTYPRRFDLLIVDEAHNVAPSGRGKYATDSLRTLAIRTLAPHFEHRLFLSATPHNGYPESFTALLELLDNQRFARGVTPDRKQLDAVMVRRLKSELPPRWDGTPRFATRTLAALEVSYTPAEREAHQLLQAYTRSRVERARDPAEQVASEFVLKLLKKRLFSSPEAFHKTLTQHRATLATGGNRSPAARPQVGILRAQIDRADEEFGDDDAADETLADALDMTSRLFQQPNAAEQQLLDGLATWAAAARGRPDSKTAVLFAWLRQMLRTADDGWNDARVIIFTEYRDTQRWLQQLLTYAGFGGERLMTLYGGMQSEDRERIKAAFQAEPALAPVRILLATDAASEGIDLQNHCSRLIHFEVPWNPNRMEQRNGRVDRHGQRAPQVQIFHFVSQGWDARRTAADTEAGTLAADLEFLLRAALKVNQIREDLGKVGSVIAEQVEEAMLGRRVRLDTAASERDDAAHRRLPKFERQLREQIAALYEQLQESRRDLQLDAARVQRAVTVALELAGQPALRPVQLDDGRTAYTVPALTGSWAACTDGLAHPHTHVQRPIVFEHNAASGRDDVVLAHLGHRLVAMALRLLRAEVWAGAAGKLARVTARTVPTGTIQAPVVVAYARLLVLGGDQQRLHEEIIVAGGLLEAGKLTRLGVTETRRVLAAATDRPVPATLHTRFATLWPQIEGPLFAALEARQRERFVSMERQLTERKAKETADIAAILTELRRTIEAELHTPEIVQPVLPGFSSEEREQFARNIDSLRARVARIPTEIADEQAAVAARYADPQPKLFPVAVTYLVPEGLAQTVQ